MNPCNYTNRGEEVPLGVECALPYLEPVDRIAVQRADSRQHAGMHPLVWLASLAPSGWGRTPCRRS